MFLPECSRWLIEASLQDDELTGETGGETQTVLTVGPDTESGNAGGLVPPAAGPAELRRQQHNLHYLHKATLV